MDVEGRKEGGKRNDRNRGRFAAIALPRSYRPEPPDSILLVPHIPMYMHTYLLFVRVHTYILRSHDSFSARFFTSSTSLFFIASVPFSLLWLLVHHRVRKCLVATVCNRHTIHRFLRRLIATRAGIHYTSDFLSISCGTPRNLRIRRCQMIFNPIGVAYSEG